MKVLYLGDIVGRAAREAVARALPGFRERLGLDFVVVNAENAAGGFGLNERIANELFGAGADVIVTGNHGFDQSDSLPLFDAEPRLLRPYNYPASAPGRGLGIYELGDGRKAGVLQLMGRLFMDPLDDPFACAEAVMAELRVGRDLDFLLVDVHAEATSEKMALGHLLDGRVSAVIGTHTHVPTADIQILPRGTAYQSDAGMCGDYDSVIGMEKTEPIDRFRRKMNAKRLEPATGAPTICGIYLEIDPRTGLARRAAPVRQGGRLSQAWPG